MADDRCNCANVQLEGGHSVQKTIRASLVALVAGLLPASALAQTCNTADRSVLLILDASGSMNAKLPNGETRIAVAQRAIKGVAGFIPAQAQLSLRMYGAQSPARQKNCQDTHLAVPFGAGERGRRRHHRVGRRRQGAGLHADRLFARSKPRTIFPADAKERVIVLVSDGKETCQGDPVVAAKALAAKGITVHTVGFVVDTAARGQLQAIARATGGTYFDAPVGPELPDTLKSAFNACKKRVVTLPPKPQPGKLRTTSAIYSHDIINAETGQKVAYVRPRPDPGRAAGRHLRGEVRTGKLEGDRGALRRDHHDRARGVEGRGRRFCQRAASSIPKPARSMERSTTCRRS